eukprot:Gb_19877 [translate_table: standard]
MLPACIIRVNLRRIKGGNGRSSKKDDGEYKLPSGSSGWPFMIGETVSWYLCMSNNRPQQFAHDQQRLYGDIFRSHLFGKPIIVSVDPNFNKFVSQNEGKLFQARYPKSVVDLMGKYGMISVHGDLQRKLHGIAMVLNLMAKQLLDLSPSKETDDIAKQFEHFSSALLSLPVKIPGSTYARGMKARDFLKRKIYEIIEQRRKHPKVVHNDLLTKLLKEDSLSDEMVTDFLIFLLFAGHETSSRSMVFCIKFLTECPKALEQLTVEHEGIQKRKGNEQRLSWDDYISMPFTQCVINETLRLSHITKGFIRETMEDVKVKEKYYAAALTFDPWRWQTNEQVSNNIALLMPFGGGPRLCPGAQLARLEVALFLHHFVTRFRKKFGSGSIFLLPGSIRKYHPYQGQGAITLGQLGSNIILGLVSYLSLPWFASFLVQSGSTIACRVREKPSTPWNTFLPCLVKEHYHAQGQGASSLDRFSL